MSLPYLFDLPTSTSGLSGEDEPYLSKIDSKVVSLVAGSYAFSGVSSWLLCDGNVIPSISNGSLKVEQMVIGRSSAICQSLYFLVHVRAAEAASYGRRQGLP